MTESLCALVSFCVLSASVQVSLLDWAVLFVKKDQGKATDFVNMLSKVCPPIGMEVSGTHSLPSTPTPLFLGPLPPIEVYVPLESKCNYKRVVKGIAVNLNCFYGLISAVPI